MFIHSGPPVLFFCAFIGFPLMFVGGAMCMLSFVGAFLRYIAAEQVTGPHKLLQGIRES